MTLLYKPESNQRGPLRWRLLGGLAGCLAAVAVAVAVVALNLTGAGRHSPAAAAPPGWHRPSVTAAGLVERSGVRMLRVDVTGGGGLIDLRYQVLDPDKAAALHDEATPPAIVDETTGLVVHQLFMDHAHSGPYQRGVTYYYLFEDPGNWVHRGDKVSVLLGDAQLQHIVVG